MYNVGYLVVREQFSGGIPKTFRRFVSDRRGSSAGSSDTAVKTETPNFRSVKTTGDVLPVNPYSRTIIEMGPVPVTEYKTVYKNMEPNLNGLTVSCTFYHPALPAISQWTALDKASAEVSYANMRSLALLNKHIENMQVDLMTDIAESDKTARMLLDTVRRVYNLVKGKNPLLVPQKTRQKSRSASVVVTIVDVRKSKKGIANKVNKLFLEYNYGWRPLIASIDGMVKTLVDHIIIPPERLKYSGKGESLCRWWSPWVTSTTVNYCPQVRRRTRYELQIQIWHGGIIKSEWRTRNTSVPEMLGLTPLQLPGTLWELTWCSFVADYYINLNNVIANLKVSPAKLIWKSLYKSTKFTLREYVEVEHIPTTLNSDWRVDVVDITTSMASRTTTWFERSKISDPLSLVVLPTLVPITNDHLLKTASVLAEVVGVFKKRRTPFV